MARIQVTTPEPANGPTNSDFLRSPTKATCFNKYIRNVWSDYLSIAVVAGLMGGIYFMPIHQMQYRVVPLFSSTNCKGTGAWASELMAPIHLSYPFVEEPLSTLSCALVVVWFPILVVASFQFKIRDLWDLHAGILGLLRALVSSTFVCVLLKNFVGGFRPHYMEICKPNLTLAYMDAQSQVLWFDPGACTGTRHAVEKALQTFPSGHTANSFAPAAFLALFLNAKLKVFAGHNTNLLLFGIMVSPLIGAGLVAVTMYISHQHHAFDIIAGLLLGLSLGTLAYRSSYASVLDFRNNHIPLRSFSIRPKVNPKISKFAKNRNTPKRSKHSVNTPVPWIRWKMPQDRCSNSELEALFVERV